MALKRAIVEAENRVEALAAVITDPVQVDQDRRELARLWTAVWDRLLGLRTDFSALLFNSDHHDA